MNYVFNNLTDALSEEFKKFDLDEVVHLNLSKLVEYDLQINNLVKYNKSEFFKDLQKNIVNKISSSEIFQTVDENELVYVNLFMLILSSILKYIYKFFLCFLVYCIFS